jgi:hypothetical protein
MPSRPQSLTPQEVRSILDGCLDQFDGVAYTFHSRQRGSDRQFDDFDVRHALKNGVPTVDCWDEKYQNWKYKVRGTDVDGDDLTVVIVIEDQRSIVRIITAYG